MKKQLYIISSALVLACAFTQFNNINAEDNTKTTETTSTEVSTNTKTTVEAEKLEVSVESYRELRVRFNDPSKLGGLAKFEVWNEDGTELISTRDNQLVYKGFKGLFLVPLEDGVYENGEKYTFKLFFERNDGATSITTEDFVVKGYYSVGH